MGELVATFALAQDSAFGQPLESRLRSCLLADAMRTEAGFDEGVRRTACIPRIRIAYASVATQV